MSEKPDVTMGEMTKTNGKSGRKVPKKIIWTIGAVAVAAIISIIGICSGAFLSRSNRILLAARNTIKDLPTVVENRNAADIIASGKYTIGVKGAVRGKDLMERLNTKIHSCRQGERFHFSVGRIWIFWQTWMMSRSAQASRCLQIICWYTITKKRKTAT